MQITVHHCLAVHRLRSAQDGTLQVKKKKTVYDSAVPFFWSWGKTKKKKKESVSFRCPVKGLVLVQDLIYCSKRERILHI